MVNRHLFVGISKIGCTSIEIAIILRNMMWDDLCKKMLCQVVRRARVTILYPNGYFVGPFGGLFFFMGAHSHYGPPGHPKTKN